MEKRSLKMFIVLEKRTVLIILCVLCVTSIGFFQYYGLLRRPRQFSKLFGVTYSIPVACQLSKKKSVIFYIFSGLENFESRFRMRSTFLQPTLQLMYNFSYVFIVGEPNDEKKDQPFFQTNTTFRYLFQAIQLEQQRYSDILLTNRIDSYHKLVNKSNFTLQTLAKHCTNSTDFFIKIDDDMMVNLEGLKKLLPTVKSDGLNCLNMGPQPAIRDERHRWYVSMSEFNGTNYEEYCSGIAVIIPPKGVVALAKGFQTMVRCPVWIEDACVYGFVRKAANFSLYTIPNPDSIYFYNKDANMLDTDKNWTTYVFINDDASRWMDHFYYYYAPLTKMLDMQRTPNLGIYID